MAVAPEQVIVHPLVLLSVVDHYQRAALGPGKRVVGILLGNWTGRTVHITNSYAVPFEENEADPTVWYLDHNYLENMSELYKKINAKERPVGWYHSGPKLRASDVKIHTTLREYCTSPVLCIIDAKCSGGMPVQAYHALQEDPSQPPTFAHVPSFLEADEPEAVGVEHLLRDLRGPSGSLTHAVSTKIKSLAELDAQLGDLDAYLQAVVEGRLPVRQEIVGGAQDMFNLLPDVHSRTSKMALTVKTNDQMAMVYVSALARAVIAVNDLIANKAQSTTPL
ncbi:Mov34-domain-containing protein [Paramicrosporidium saccamoebae]|uniref:Mov34-domain-containing protein n=1 Tax=Paramicrosporidium saccamoebae TaxID=1246581 RepID=A0A2H9TFH6_9FUNG|nr:Mov34-domain-containing protein [Paramicrosporidium saccamoebae]